MLLMTTEDSAVTVYASILQMKKILFNIDGWLGKAIEHARALSFDPSILASARLSPDQIPLSRQIQNACDRAKYAAAWLAGKDGPRHADTEQTIDELRARIRMCSDYLDTFEAGDFRGAATRMIALPFLDDRRLIGDTYLRELVLPGFYFHAATAYAILRHNGVPLSLRDFIGAMPTAEAS
jgi:hypothetical protein